MINFNEPYLTGKELDYIRDAVEQGKISGNGHYTRLCQAFFQERFRFNKCLLTTSCTDALEMAAILCGIQPGDEVIVPSFTFVSTANAFVLRGAKIVFIDSRTDHPGMDEDQLESLITEKTKAIVPVHYAGVACDMDRILEIAERHHLFVIEDAAQAIDSTYKGKQLGGIGHLSCFSFHETKNIQCGEGGMLVVNDECFLKRAEIIWEKGTNRAEFFRGEVNKYGWVDIGSSFLPSELNAAYLYAQFENMDPIQQRRKEIWDQYHEGLEELEKRGLIRRPEIPEYASNNAHMYYIMCRSYNERNELIRHMKQESILSVFHYLALHKSPYYLNTFPGETRAHPRSEDYEDRLLRLPFHLGLTDDNIRFILKKILEFFHITQ